MRTTAFAAAAVLAAGVNAENYLGFNSGSTLADRSAKFKADFLAEFNTAQKLQGAPGTFNAVRLYTNIQAYSETDPISAFEAAIETNTRILLGVWASGTSSIQNEITALQTAIKTYGTKLTDLIIGVSVGSEDLYRNSVTGVANEAGVGADPDVLVGFIKDFRKAFASSAISKIPVGHVDTWDVWPNATNKAVLDAIDFIGVDEYPYYESGKGNNIKNAGSLFDRAYDATVAAANGKPVWVTETGWPTTGPDWDEAHPSVENAKYYWNEVFCRKLLNQTSVFWYNLRDSNPDNTMKFAITDNLSTKPYFDLSCPTTFDTTESSSTSSSASPSGTATVAPVSSGTTSSSPETSGSSSSGSGSGSSSGTGSSSSSASGTVSGSGSSTGASSGSSTSTGASATNTSGASSSAKIGSAALAGIAVVAGIFSLL
jgi:glucan endo-1,3-beta-D-glucosidase